MWSSFLQLRNPGLGGLLCYTSKNVDMTLGKSINCNVDISLRDKDLSRKRSQTRMTYLWSWGLSSQSRRHPQTSIGLLLCEERTWWPLLSKSWSLHPSCCTLSWSYFQFVCTDNTVNNNRWNRSWLFQSRACVFPSSRHTTRHDGFLWCNSCVVTPGRQHWAKKVSRSECEEPKRRTMTKNDKRTRRMLDPSFKKTLETVFEQQIRVPVATKIRRNEQLLSTKKRICRWNEKHA